MLLYFRTANSRSYGHEVEFSMISTDDHSTLSQNIVPIEDYGIAVLKSSVIYGGNASGKSNLLKAMTDGAILITNVKNESDDDLVDRDEEENVGKLKQPYSKHLAGYNSRPTRYVYEILVDGVHFEYSFSHSRERVYNEKLVENPPHGEKKIIHFHRYFHPLDEEYKQHTDDESLLEKPENLYLKGMYRVVNSQALLLTMIARIDNKELRSDLIVGIFNWFKQLYFSIGGGDGIMDRFQQFTSLNAIEQDQDVKTTFLKWLETADITISDIVFDKVLDNEGKTRTKITTRHKGVDESVEFSFFGEESTGTQQLVKWVVPWVRAFRRDNQVFLIDELANNLHPLLVRFLLKIFHEQSNQSQLIFSTHDASILASDLMRPDQIWFVNRDSSGNSSLKPRSDYKIPKGKLLDYVYLQGVLGGVPYITDIHNVQQNGKGHNVVSEVA